MPSVLKGANVTAQWYQDTYLGLLFPSLEKVCLHTTETESWPGYAGGASAPNATYHPRLRQIRQHFENNRSARALKDPSSTPVRENRDKVWQLEIIAYSDYAIARRVGGLWIGDLTDAHFTDIAWMLIQLNKDLKLPLTSQIRWAEGQKTFVSGRRLSSSGWDACRGVATHFAVSGNSHWDAGGFYYSRLAAKIKKLLTPVTPPSEDLVTSQTEFNLLMANFIRGATVEAAKFDQAQRAAVIAGVPGPVPNTMARAGKDLGVLSWWQVLGRHDSAGRKPAPNMHGVMAVLKVLADKFDEGGELNAQLDKIVIESMEDNPEVVPPPPPPAPTPTP